MFWLFLLALSPGHTSPARAWTPGGTAICTQPQRQDAPTITPDGAGGAVIAWTDSRSGAAIYAQRVDSNGVAQWAPGGVLVRASSGSPGRPVAQLFLGTALIVWQEEVNGNRDLIAQRLDSQGAPMWAAAGVPIANSTDDDEHPVLIGNSSNGTVDPIGLIIAWSQIETTPDALRRHSIRSIGLDGAPLWAAGTVGLVPGYEHRSDPVIASDGSGTIGRARGAVVAWSERGSGTAGSDIFARRVSASGAPLWTLPAGIVCDEAGDQVSPAIVTVGSSTVIAWSDARGLAGTDLYAQKLNNSGSSQWTANGRPVCTASGSQQSPRIVADNAGGAVIAWDDTRAGSSRPYAQRIDPSGNPLWGSDGVALSDQAVGSGAVVMVSDGAGGAIVAWLDRRAGEYDVYAQRVDVNGIVLWGPGGAPLCASDGLQTGVVLVRDAGLGAIAAWADARGGLGTEDIYANRAYAATGTVDAPHAAPETAALALQSPNPTRGAVRLRLDLREPAAVSAEVLDVTGRRVRTLLSDVSHGSGTHTLYWDGAGEGGAPVPAGLYLVRVRAGERTWTARVARVR